MEVFIEAAGEGSVGGGTTDTEEGPVLVYELFSTTEREPAAAIVLAFQPRGFRIAYEVVAYEKTLAVL